MVKKIILVSTLLNNRKGFVLYFLSAYSGGGGKAHSRQGEECRNILLGSWARSEVREGSGCLQQLCVWGQSLWERICCPGIWSRQAKEKAQAKR